MIGEIGEIVDKMVRLVRLAHHMGLIETLGTGIRLIFDIPIGNKFAASLDLGLRRDDTVFVMPAKAGIQKGRKFIPDWYSIAGGYDL